jgi:REP element-mobilizing transposase RayT
MEVLRGFADGTRVAPGLDMTAPRQVLPNTTYLVTRRCSQRQFLLRPSRTTNEVFGYLLAVAGRRYGVLVHAYCVMSNHFHLVVTDRKGRLPAFGQYLEGLVARALNATLGRWESFWAPSSYSAVRLETAEDVVEKVAYTLANPVAAGLVRHGREWPGLWSAPERMGGRAEKRERPKEFFNPTGTMPESEELALEVPRGFGSAEEFRRRVRERVEELEGEAAKKRRGRGFLGSRRVQAQRPTDRPGTGEGRRGLNPRVAAMDRWKRVEALARLKEFVGAYREALRRYLQGARGVIFPAGTYLLRVRMGVRCAAAG